MKHKFVRKIVAIFTLLALTFSAWGVTPAHADTLTVTNASDSGTGSLRAAIAAAAPGDTILFTGNYAIQLASTLTIDKNLTIDGTGHNIILSGDSNGDSNADVRVMYINGVNVTLKHLTITKGKSTDHGGGIYNYGGTLTVTDCAFSGNSATKDGGGIYNRLGILTVTDSAFSGNNATTNGGGIHNGGGTLTVTGSAFSGNSATYGGGIENGGIYSDYGTLSVTNSTFSGNSAIDGGGIYNGMFCTITVTDSTFSGNSATNGGGIENYGGVLSMTDSVFSGNSATNGGGIYNESGSGTDTCASDSAATLANNTFSGNSATDGGGIYNGYGVITLLFNTITASPSGGGVWSYNDDSTCTKAGSNIIAGNMGYDLSADLTAQRFYSLGYNLVGVAGTNVDFSQEFNQAGDQVNVADPKLGSLANNGGPTQTHALLPGSPAIDAGTNSGCPATDQRGKPRPVDGDLNGTAICDIGAYELVTGKKTFNSQATYDGWVLESSETSGKGGTKNNKATTLYLGDDASNKQYRSILSFNTSGIPAGANITRVTLKIKRSGVVGGGNPIKTFKGLLLDIKKGNFGTASLALGDFQAKPDKTYGPFKPALSGGWYSLDLTSGLTYLNRSGNTQIRLRFKLDDNNNSIANYLKLYSGNAPTASRPQLVVEYYIP